MRYFLSLLLILGIVGVAILFLKNQPVVDLKESISLEIQQKTTLLLTQRYGSKNIQVIANINLQPSSNATVFEVLTPIKVNTTTTKIASKSSQQPYQLPNQNARAADASFLPGMGQLYTDQSNLQTEGSKTMMSQSSVEDKEQELTEHVYYNKETKSVEYFRDIQSISVAVFIPQDRLSLYPEDQIKQELAMFIDPLNKYQLLIMINPLQSDTYIASFFKKYDQFKQWVFAHPLLTISMIGALIISLGLIKYVTYRMDYQLKKQPKTIVVQEPNHSLNMNENKPLISAPTNQIVSYLEESVFK